LKMAGLVVGVVVTFVGVTSILVTRSYMRRKAPSPPTALYDGWSAVMQPDTPESTSPRWATRVWTRWNSVGRGAVIV
jgi:hypothetical protein